jgi:PAS domain S-box-containing protein
MDEGFCSIEVIFDASGEKAIDYRFLEINPAFEKLTGISQEEALHGKTIRQIIPNLEEKWFEIYGRVALTGEPVRFVEGSEAMGLWFDIYAFRIGEPENRRVALLFNDITNVNAPNSNASNFSGSLKRSGQD